MLSASLNKAFPSFLPSFQTVQRYQWNVFTCPYTFIFRTRPLAGSLWHGHWLCPWQAGSTVQYILLPFISRSSQCSHDWCNKGHGMCYPVCGMMHIKEPLLLIGKSSLCGSSRFPLLLSEWSFSICLTPYNRK